MGIFSSSCQPRISFRFSPPCLWNVPHHTTWIFQKQKLQQPAPPICHCSIFKHGYRNKQSRRCINRNWWQQMISSSVSDSSVLGWESKLQTCHESNIQEPRIIFFQQLSFQSPSFLTHCASITTNVKLKISLWFSIRKQSRSHQQDRRSALRCTAGSLEFCSEITTTF